MCSCSSMPEVSVILPVYNGAAYVEESLCSVLTQQNVDFEVVLGDNASSDDTLNIVRRYTEDPRLRIVKNDRNLGIFGNLNRLVSEARSPLVKILCADDWILPGGLAAQVRYMEQQPSIAFSRCIPMGALSNYYALPDVRYEASLPEILHPPAGLLALATFGCLCGNLTNVIARRQALLSCGPFDQSFPYVGDYEQWARMARTQSFGLQCEELVFVRSHEQQCSITLNKQNETTDQIGRLLCRLQDEIPAQHRSILRLHWTVTHVAQQWHKGLECLLQGRWYGFYATFASRPYSYSNIISFLLYIVSLEGRLIRPFTTSILAKCIAELNWRRGKILEI